jgi:AcrR family transcriptional regulator
MAVRNVVAAESSDTTRRILTAASEEFAQRGFASARVRDIVDAAQVNLAAVNYYFGGKEGLYSATLRHLAGDRRAIPANRRGSTPAERLQRHVFTILERFIGGKRPSALSRILAHEAMNPTPHHERLIEDMIRPELEGVSAIVREIAGDEADEMDIARAAVSVMGQCVFYLFSRGPLGRLHPELTHGPNACRELSRHITEFSLAGIARLGANGGPAE